MTLDALEQSDVVHEMKRTKKVTGKNGRTSEISIKGTCAYFEEKYGKTHCLASDRLTGALTRVGAYFFDDAPCRRAWHRLEVRHGRTKGTLKKCAYKLEVWPRVVAKTHASETIYMVDFILYREQCPGGMKALGSVALEGRDKKKGAELTIGDIGLLPYLVAVLEVRNYVVQTYGSKVFAKLSTVFCHILDYEKHYPADRTRMLCQDLQLDVAWLSTLSNKLDVIYRDLMVALYENTYMNDIKGAMIKATAVEGTQLIDQSVEIKAKLKDPDDELNASAKVDAATTSGVTGGLEGDAGASEPCNDNDDASELTAEQERGKQTAKLTARAKAKREGSHAFVVVPPDAPKLIVKNAIESHPIYHQTVGKWGKRHIGFVVDCANGPETALPSRKPPNPTTLKAHGKPRIEASLEIISGSAALLSFDGFSFANRILVHDIVSAHQKQCPGKVFLEHVSTCGFCVGEVRPRARGLFGAKDWQTLAAHVTSDLYSVASTDRSDGKNSSSCRWQDLKLTKPAAVPNISLDVKQNRWPGTTINNDSITPGPRDFKRAEKKWRKHLPPTFFNLQPEFLANACGTFKLSLVVCLTPGWRTMSIAQLFRGAIACPVISLANSAGHQTLMQDQIDKYVLRAMMTEGRTCHNEIVCAEML